MLKRSIRWFCGAAILAAVANGAAGADQIPNIKFFDLIIAGQACEPARIIAISLTDGITYECSTNRTWVQKFGSLGTTCGSTTGSLHKCTTHITASQIKAMHASPITLVAAAGGNTVIVPSYLVVQYHQSAQRLCYGSGINFEYILGTEGLQYYVDGTEAGEPFSAAGGETVIALPLIANLAASTGRTDSTIAASSNKPLTLADPYNELGSKGYVLTTSIATGGALWSPGDQAVCHLGNGNTPLFIVDTVSAGAVTAVHPKSDGDNAFICASPETGVVCDADGGTGTGLTINVLTVSSFTGSMDASVIYTVETLQ